MCLPERLVAGAKNGAFQACTSLTAPGAGATNLGAASMRCSILEGKRLAHLQVGLQVLFPELGQIPLTIQQRRLALLPDVRVCGGGCPVLQCKMSHSVRPHRSPATLPDFNTLLRTSSSGCTVSRT